MTEGKGLAKTAFCEQQSLNSAMKKTELRLGFFAFVLGCCQPMWQLCWRLQQRVKILDLLCMRCWVMSSDHCRRGWAWAGSQKGCSSGGQKQEMSWWQDWVRPQPILLHSLAVMTGATVWWCSPKRAAALQTCGVKWWK